jgi:virulence-associated protein VapD
MATVLNESIVATPGASDSGITRPRTYWLVLAMNIARISECEKLTQDCVSWAMARVLGQYGFRMEDDGRYRGAEGTTPVTCVLAVEDLARSLPWFSRAIEQATMFDGEDHCDLMPAVQQSASW